MTWTARKKLGGYGGVPGLKIRITQPGSATSLTSPAMIPMTEIADELFAAEIPDNLVGHFEYRIFRVDSPIWDGWLRRYPNQSSVILDDPRAISDITSDDASTPFPVGGGLTFPELHGGVFPQPAQVEVGVIYGPLGNDKTGTLVAASGGQTEILNAIAALGMEGDYKITVEVLYNGGGIPGSTVSLVGVTGKAARTGTSGSAVIHVDGNATYTLRVTPPVGFAVVPDQPVVVGSADVSVGVTIAIDPVDMLAAPLTNVLLPTEDQYGNRYPGVTVKLSFVGHLPGATVTGVVMNQPSPKKSGADGVCRVQLRRMASYLAEYTIPGDGPRRVSFSTGNTGTDLVTG